MTVPPSRERARRCRFERRTPSRIDRDSAWLAKRAALEVVFAAPRSPGRQSSLDAFVAAEGRPLADFALWCALEEHYAGTLADGEERPDEAWDIGSPLIARLRGELAERVAFHSWLQWVADDQVRAAQARREGRRDAHRHHARPCGGRAHEGIGCLVPA